MRPILAIAFKDIRLLLRNKGELFGVVAFPCLMAILFGAVFSSFGGGGGGGASRLNVVVDDQDRSDYAAGFIRRLDALDGVTVTTGTLESGRDQVRRGRATALIVINPGFSESYGLFPKDDRKALQMAIDPSRAAEAGFLEGMLTQAAFQELATKFTTPEFARGQIATIREQLKSANASGISVPLLDQFLVSADAFIATDPFANDSPTTATASASDNGAAGPLGGLSIDRIPLTREQRPGSRPRTSFEISVPSGAMWGLIGASMYFAVSLVTERSRGTLLRLRSAPVSRRVVLAGKGVGCWLACMGVLTFMLGLAVASGKLSVDSWPHLLLAMAASSYAFVGISMVISLFGRTEAAVQSYGWGIMSLCAMFGGAMMPLAFMPGWLFKASAISPVRWSVLAVEGAIWRSFSFSEMLMPLGVMIGLGTFFLVLAELRMRQLGAE